MIPWWSVFTLCTELIVTICVYFILYRAFTSGVYNTRFAFGVLAYELCVNIAYMSTRLMGATEHISITTPYQTGLAIFHGVFSLIMFFALVAFFITAHFAYEKGENYFAIHKRLTWAFSVAWGISIASGLLFFIDLYFI